MNGEIWTWDSLNCFSILVSEKAQVNHIHIGLVAVNEIIIVKSVHLFGNFISFLSSKLLPSGLKYYQPFTFLEFRLDFDLIYFVNK